MPATLSQTERDALLAGSPTRSLLQSFYRLPHGYHLATAVGFSLSCYYSLYKVISLLF